MATDLTAALATLLDHWNMLAQDAAERANVTLQPSMGGFYMRRLFGILV
jgi:hypothetical protein